jgi:hypothetical protein
VVINYFKNIVHEAFFLILLVVLLAGHYVEFILRFSPCALCYLQRFGMLLAAFSLVLFWKEGGTKSLGICLLSSLFGFIVALRHVSLKYCCNVSLTPIVFGRSLPAWSLCVFGLSMLGIAALLLLYGFCDKNIEHEKRFKRGSYLLFIFLLIGLVSAFVQRGFSF